MKSGDDRSRWLAAILLTGACRKISTTNCFAPGQPQRCSRTFVDDDGGCDIARGYVRSSEFGFSRHRCRRTNGSRPFGLPLPKQPRLRATASAALSRAARIAIPVIVLNGISGVASAQNAQWRGPTADWNTSTNWNPMTVPGPSGVATFTGFTPTSISMAGAVDVGTLQFTAPNYTFDVLGSTNINGIGIQALPANAPTFNVISGGGG